MAKSSAISFSVAAASIVSEPEENALYSINVAQELTGTEENANEEFLAEFRDWLKKLEDKNSFAIIIPFAENASATQEQKEIFTASFKHCARRIKDCVSVAGYKLPEELIKKGFSEASPASNFMDTISIKHAQYVNFASKIDGVDFSNTEEKLVIL